ncbi:hypothetical protein C8Q76DRAFT_460868 [Earliella scabrosa]|nr:hypothetical protein C8Q76DRAFT_460868 [Earliella scabrosa]
MSEKARARLESGGGRGGAGGGWREVRGEWQRALRAGASSSCLLGAQSLSFRLRRRCSSSRPRPCPPRDRPRCPCPRPAVRCAHLPLLWRPRASGTRPRHRSRSPQRPPQSSLLVAGHKYPVLSPLAPASVQNPAEKPHSSVPCLTHAASTRPTRPPPALSRRRAASRPWSTGDDAGTIHLHIDQPWFAESARKASGLQIILLSRNAPTPSPSRDSGRLPLEPQGPSSNRCLYLCH